MSSGVHRDGGADRPVGLRDLHPDQRAGSRTLRPFLVALPVRISEILAAKLLAIVCLSSLVTLPLFLVDLFWGAGNDDAVGLAAAAVPVLVSAIAMSTASALLIRLLARDFRAANNVDGALLAPLLVVSLPLAIFSPRHRVRLRRAQRALRARSGRLRRGRDQGRDLRVGAAVRAGQRLPSFPGCLHSISLAW